LASAITFEANGLDWGVLDAIDDEMRSQTPSLLKRIAQAGGI
jgi:hypothetical protein